MAGATPGVGRRTSTGRHRSRRRGLVAQARLSDPPRCACPGPGARRAARPGSWARTTPVALGGGSSSRSRRHGAERDPLREVRSTRTRSMSWPRRQPRRAARPGGRGSRPGSALARAGKADPRWQLMIKGGDLRRLAEPMLFRARSAHSGRLRRWASGCQLRIASLIGRPRASRRHWTGLAPWASCSVTRLPSVCRVAMPSTSAFGAPPSGPLTPGSSLARAAACSWRPEVTEPRNSAPTTRGRPFSRAILDAPRALGTRPP